jgi:hypothetical protein
LLKVKVEDTNALRFILQDEIYLLDQDKNLYANAPVPQPQIQTPQPVFNYLGGNKKNFLILVSYDEHEFMGGEHLEALENVLNGKGLGRDDVAIVNLAKHPTADHQQLITYFEPKTLLVLGMAAIPEGMAGASFNTIQKGMGPDVLCTFSFDEMMPSVENKKAFWGQVKNL